MWNSRENKKCPEGDLYGDLNIYRDIVTLIWILIDIQQQIVRILYPKWATSHKELLLLPWARPDSKIIGNGPRIRKNVQMRLIAGQGISAKMIT